MSTLLQEAIKSMLWEDVFAKNPLILDASP
jgi:hypothetical protein